MRRRLVPIVVIVFAAASCGGSPSTSDPRDDVVVTLKDFSLDVRPGSFAPGSITFDIANEGPSAHEFVILRTDDAPDALPIENDLIPEDQIDLVDEAEDIAPGVKTRLTSTLAAGSYVLVCNLPSHYGAGMHAAFTVG